MKIGTEQDIDKTMVSQGATVDTNYRQVAEQLADSLWRIAESWNDFAKATMAIPMARAMDEVNLHLRLTLGRTQIKQHLQHIENARRGLIPVDYYLQRAQLRGLIDTVRAQQLRSQMIIVAQRLDQHRQSIIQEANKNFSEKNQQDRKAKAEPVEPNPDLSVGTAASH